jgi:hypothetical protein
MSAEAIFLLKLLRNHLSKKFRFSIDIRVGSLDQLNVNYILGMIVESCIRLV